MSTLTIAIGNSDDKLTQHQWSTYWGEVNGVVARFARHVHGVFLSLPNSTYQNACWAFEGDLTDELRAELAYLAKAFWQDSIAVSVGTTEMVTPS